MREFREDDFKKMAQGIVNEYLEKDSPLDESLAKMSEDMGLNPDQIQNLVQLANSLAHLTLFDNKNDGDKIIDFSPADPDVVLKKVYKDNAMPESQEIHEAPCPGSKETDFFGDFPDISTKIREALKPEAPSEINEPISTTSPNQRSMMIIKIRKVASELKDKELASAIEYREELDKLASDFAKLYGPDFMEFEKNALALRGDIAVDVLTDIRSCLRVPGPVPNVSTEKVACVIDTDVKEIRSLDKLIKLAEDHADYSAAYNKLQQKAKGVL